MKKIIKVKLTKKIRNELLKTLKLAYIGAYYTDEEFDSITNREIIRIEKILKALGVTQEEFDKI